MMMPDSVAKLRRSIVEHESYRKIPYVDTMGKITIGIGYNLTDRGIDDEWINDQYQRDIAFFYNRLTEDFPWFKELNTDRQIVLIDMAFMGYKHFLSFERMLTALGLRDYRLAASEMMDSKWAEQTKGRAAQLAHAMLTGVYEI